MPVDDSVRNELIAILPRLKRFAEVLIGGRDDGTALLGRALQRMLEEHHRYQRGTPVDRWAFGEIYRLWLQELRSQTNPMRRPTGLDSDFQALIDAAGEVQPDALTVSFIANLPPQQRSTLLLVYGEGLTHAEAGQVLDCPSDTIEARLVRASASLADAISEAEDEEPVKAAPGPAASSNVEPLRAPELRAAS